MNTFRTSRGSIKYLLLELLMILLVIVYLVPVYMAALYIFKNDNDEFLLDAIQPPTELYFGNFAKAVKSLDLFRTLGNTMVITVSSVLLIVILSVMAAYAISRSRLSIYKSFYLLFISGILVPYQAIFVPIYIIGSKVGFVNNFFGVIFFQVATGLPFAVFMMTSFMKTLPFEIEEAAVMDGCSVMRMVPTIIFPMMKPAIVTISVMTSILVWNDYLLPLLFLQKPKLQPVTVKLALLFRQYQWDLNVAFTGILLSSIPVLLFFLFTQKHYIKGIAAGALKG